MIDPVVAWLLETLERRGPLSEIFLVFFVLLALILSIHVTLYKRDPRSAIGWIGLIWLSPIIGSFLYLLLGVNRVFRQKVRLRRFRKKPRRTATQRETQLNDSYLKGWEPIVHAGDQITRKTCLHGNQGILLDGGDEAYPRMLDAIRNAKQSIGLMTYIFDRDATGKEFVAALAEAKARGVKVRVLIDGVGAALGINTITWTLARARVPYAVFLPAHFPRSSLWVNMRNHRKLMTVDGEIAFTGGMNITESCRLSRAPERGVVDVHFEVRGPVVRELQEAFADDWFFAGKEVLDGPEWFPGDIPSAAEGGVPARAVLDGPDQTRSHLPWILMAALSRAQKKVSIVTPYYVPDRAVQSAIGCASLRGVQVEILVPYLSDARIVDWASRRHLRYVAQQGVRVWETPLPFSHTKLTLIDDHWYCIGSSNWDTRSFRLNFELNVEFYDPRGSSSIRTYIERLRGSSREITQELCGQQPMWRRIRNGVAWLGSPYL
jgi:cardiolipin synthase